MTLTTSFIAENFDRFNKAYFNGTLQTPDFEVIHRKSRLGEYHWKYGFNGSLIESVIRISDMIDRTETDYQNTIIHEMIHLYIRQNRIKDTRPHHGRVFNSIADRINIEGGWHIARTDSVAGCGLSDKSEVRKYIIACFKRGESGKYFRFCINPKYLEYYKRKFDRYPSHYRDVFVYTSDDDKAYAHYSQCYRGVRGYYITKEEFDHARDNENVIFRTLTLSVYRKVS